MLEARRLLTNEDFAAARPRLEHSVLRAKELRRLHVGSHFTFLFENEETLLWQVQEMCRVEQITAPDAIAHELDTYGALLGTERALSATLLVEYDVADERDRMLRALRGIENAVRLEVAGVEAVVAQLDDAQFDQSRISSVQFVRFPLTAEQRAAFLDFARAAIVRVDHPAYRAETTLSASMRGALVEDLGG